ncbi:MAG: hypothetical protein HQ517_16855 [SAR324 cluster bacterium]|nr:hypothetical protein [SAR324 cluster bacterium]
MDGFDTGFSEIIADEKLNNWQKIEKTVEFLNLADMYLQKEAVMALNKSIKRKITKCLSPEVAELQKEIYSTVITPKILERRLRAVLKICWRYFRAKNELETKYYRKLLTDKAEEQIKGLKLAKKKLIDFELDMSE